MSGPVTDRGFGHGPCPEHVGLVRLAGVALHHGDVLVGRGMEDELGLELRHDLVHPLRVRDVADHRLDFGAIAGQAERALDLVEAVLVLLEQDHARGVARRDLTGDLGADRAAGARDHHRAVRELRREIGSVRADRLAEQQVVGLEASGQLGNLPADQHVAEVRHDAERLARLSAAVHDLLAPVARARRAGDDDLVGIALLEDPLQLVAGAEHRHVVDPHALEVRVAVHEADHPVVLESVVRDVAQHGLRRIPAAHDQNLLPQQRRVLDGLVEATQDPDPAEQAVAQHPVEHDHSARVGGEGVDRRDPQQDGERAERRGRQDALQVAHAGEPPHAAEQTEGLGPDHPDHDDEAHRMQEHPELGRRHRSVETQRERCHIRGREQHPLQGGGDRDPVTTHRGQQPVERLVGIDQENQRGRDQPEVVQQGGIAGVVPRHPDLVRKDDVDVGLLRIPALGQEVGLVPVDDGRDVRDPGACLEDRAIVLRVHHDVLLELGPRADQAHVSAQDVPELRQLVDLGLPQEVSDARDSRVAAHRDPRADLRGVVDHGAELEHGERPEVPPHAPLAEEHGARAVEPDRDGRDQEDRGEQDQARCRQQEVQHPLHRRKDSTVSRTAAITSSTSSSVIFA